MSDITEIGAPVNFDELSKFNDDITNPTLYKEKWLPKVEAFRRARELSIPDHYKVPAEEVPKDLDEKPFDTIHYLQTTPHISAEEREITNLSVTQLAEAIASGKYTAVQVFEAYAHRTVVLNQFTNHVFEFFLDEGLERAKELDAYYQTHKKTVGPLHGVPVSIKEIMRMKGKRHTGAYVSKIDNIPEEDCTTVAILRRLGAVFYVRTNEPTTMMPEEANNNYIGQTRNPNNSILSTGGSSGGEGASVSSRASAIGMGTDITGSIRAPASYCGCCGLRPTSRRVSAEGAMDGEAGQENLLSVFGPLASCVTDIDHLMKHYINLGKPWETDASCVAMPWRAAGEKYDSAADLSKIRVGILRDDGTVRPHPPISRGIQYVEEKLRAAGVDVVEFPQLLIKEADDIVCTMQRADGGHSQKVLLGESGEPLFPLVRLYLASVCNTAPMSITELRALVVRRDNLRCAYTKFLNENKIDFIIAPTHAGVAPVGRHDGIAGAYYFQYYSLFNILDFPSLAMPTGLRQDPKVDVPYTNQEYRNELDKLEGQKYIPELFVNAPISFQLAGRRYHDEDVVAFGKIVEKILQGN
ncbi:amidase [Angomonas deanei]|nr:amidase [Angomonas deanei]|eukprot:EPY18558.1 amidase [Angomonas deanei]